VRRDWADTSRRDAVLDAAAGWRAAGAIDDATLAAVAAEYPARRPRLASGWRVLVFVLVSIAANALFGAIFLFSGSGGVEAARLVYGTLLVAATEALRGSRLAGTGADGAASFWAAGYVVAGVALLLARAHLDERTIVTVSLLAAALACAAACLRWGFEAYGAFAAAAFFLLLARFPHGRLLWIAAAALILPAADRLRDRAALPPPHRAAFDGVVFVAAAALYAAVNRWSLDERFVESLRDGARPGPPSPGAQVLAAAGTVLVPAALVAAGLRRRRVLLLDAGVVAAALSLVTLRHYVHLAPLWLLLALSGAALLLGAIGLNRFLRRGPEGERAGFTASPLGASKGGGLQTAAVVAAFAPSAGPASRPDDFTPGGGGYGGGGATGAF